LPLSLLYGYLAIIMTAVVDKKATGSSGKREDFRSSKIFLLYIHIQAQGFLTLCGLYAQSISDKRRGVCVIYITMKKTGKIFKNCIDNLLFLWYSISADEKLFFFVRKFIIIINYIQLNFS
jgi:hypothetical protein